MTGKLIKYEFRSGLRNIGVIWAALIAAAVLVGIILKIMGSIYPSDPQGVLVVAEVIFNIIPPLLYGAIFVAMLVITVLIVVLRFYKGLLGDEGYLMHTLPVKPWQLITAKGVVASGIVIISGIAAVISILILAAFADVRGMLDGIGLFFAEIGDEPRIILVIIEVVIIGVISVMKSVYQIYAAMSIGQLAGKYRLLTSLGAYIAISMVLTMIVAALAAITELTGLDMWIGDMLVSIDIHQNGFAALQAALGIAFVATAIQLAAFHVISERILSKKLNLI